MEHPLDLVVAAFMQGDARKLWAENFQASRQGVNVLGVKMKSAGKCGDGRRRDRLVGFHLINFSDLGRGIHELLRPRPVIGEQDQARAVAIQSACDVECVLFRMVDEIDHGRMHGIRSGAEYAARFVKHDANPASGRAERLPVEVDLLEAVNFRRAVGGDHTIHSHAPGSDAQPRGIAADACMTSDEPVEFHGGNFAG